MSRTYYPLIFSIWLLQAIAVGLVLDQPLFWDNVLLSGRLPEFFWRTRLSQWFVPEEMAGYPPLWPAYIGQGWLWFGRGLATTHLLMLPWLWLLSFQVVRLVQMFVARRALVPAVVLLMSVPVLASLQVQCGPDIAMVGLFCWALNSILYRNRYSLAVALLGLAMISPRGLWCLVPLFVLDQLLLGAKLFTFRWLWAGTRVLAFLPAVLAGVGWMWANYRHYGWWGASPTGAWAAGAAYTTPGEYFYQMGIGLWRMADFGQVAVFVGLGAALLPVLAGRSEERAHRAVLAIIAVVTTVSFVLFFATFRNAIGHRYMVVPVLLLGLWLCYEWSEGLRYGAFRARVVFVWLFFAGGHLWVALYPAHWAKGWDGTLAHLQVGLLRRDLPANLARLGIAPGEVGARYPDEDPLRYLFISDQKGGYVEYDEAMQPYLLQPNWSNDFEPRDLEYLKQYAEPRLTVERWPAEYTVYRNRRVPRKELTVEN